MNFKKIWNRLFGSKHAVDEELKTLQRLTQELRELSGATTLMADHETTLEESLKAIKNELDKLEELCATETHSIKEFQNTHSLSEISEPMPAALLRATPPTDVLQ